MSVFQTYKHNSQNKYFVVRTLLDSAKKNLCIEEEKSLETKYVLQALSANNYPTHFFRNCQQSNTEQETSAKDAGRRGLVILPYTKGFQKKKLKVLKGFNIKVAHKLIRTISNILKNLGEN